MTNTWNVYALALNPNNLFALELKARYYHYSKVDYNQAINYYNKVIAIKQNNPFIDLAKKSIIEIKDKKLNVKN